MRTPGIVHDLYLSYSQCGRHKLMNNNRRAHRRVAGTPSSAPSPIWNPSPIVCPFSAPLTPCYDLLFAEYCIVDILVVTEIVHGINRHDERTIKILIFGGL